jgi:AraC-like DNA-binding protein
LLRLVIRSVEELGMADHRKLVDTHTGPAQAVMNGGEARLCDVRHRLAPQPAPVPAPRASTHAEQVLERLLPFIARNYARPVTLRQCAEALNMNAAYLSAIFSRIVGTPFKTYLTGMRIDQAMEMLGEPANNVATVAAAIGYASGDRFRRAFKQATGLSPTGWRAAVCVDPPDG